MAPQRFLILADGDFHPMTSKTANSVIRYLPERVVGVVDHVAAGKTARDVLGFGDGIPVVRDMDAGLALKPDAVLIGIAPMGGKLPEASSPRETSSAREEKSTLTLDIDFSDFDSL